MPPTARDSHIPTARLRGPGKVENQKRVFHYPTAARDDDYRRLPPDQETKKGSRLLRSLLLPFQDHSVLLTRRFFSFREDFHAATGVSCRTVERSAVRMAVVALRPETVS
jgi:hypothetical protein